MNAQTNKLQSFLSKEKIGSFLQKAAWIYGAASVVLTFLNTAISFIHIVSSYSVAENLITLVFSTLFALVKICITTLFIYAFGVLVEKVCGSEEKKPDAAPFGGSQPPQQ